MKLNTINPKYYTTLGKLTADANERMSVVKDINILTTPQAEQTAIAVAMFKEWQRTKKGREQKTFKLVNELQQLNKCERDDGDANKIYHHQIKENKWTEMALSPTETKYFKKKVHAKKTLIHIDVRSMTDGALLSVYVSHENDAPPIIDNQWQTNEPCNLCRIYINDMDSHFVTDKYYYIAVSTEISNVGQTRFKIRINAITQTKKNKEQQIGRGIKQRLQHRLNQIRSTNDKMIAFQQRLIEIKEKHKKEKQIVCNEKVKQNAITASDSLWSSH